MRIANLKVLIDLEQENYMTAVQQQKDVAILAQLRDRIKQFKVDLQLLLDQERAAGGLSG